MIRAARPGAVKARRRFDGPGVADSKRETTRSPLRARLTPFSTVKTYWPQGLGVEIDRPGQATEFLWTHTDHQGSVVAMTDAAGNWKERLDYDAWGKRRTTDGLSTPDGPDGQADNKGYTGHEMLDQLDLVHMNGRIYDPRLARFVSAAPLIQDPEHGQSYN